MTPRGSVAIADLTLEWRVDGAHAQAATSLLRRFPPTSREPVDCAWTVSSGDIAPHPLDSGRVAFFADASCYLLPSGELRLTSPTVSARIAADGRQVDFRLSGGSDLACVPEVAIALHLALHAHRLFHLHAAGLIHPSGLGFLFPGGTGSGKTTTTLSLLEHGSGWRFLCDDTIYLKASSAGVCAVALPGEFHATEHTLDAFPRLVSSTVGVFDGAIPKQRLDAREAFPSREAAAMPRVSRLVFPEVVHGGETRVERVPAASAFTRLLGSSALALLPLGEQATHLDTLALLAESTDAHRLLLGSDALARPGRIAELLEQLAT